VSIHFRLRHYSYELQFSFCHLNNLLDQACANLVLNFGDSVKLLVFATCKVCFNILISTEWRLRVPFDLLFILSRPLHP